MIIYTLLPAFLAGRQGTLVSFAIFLVVYKANHNDGIIVTLRPIYRPERKCAPVSSPTFASHFFLSTIEVIAIVENMLMKSQMDKDGYPEEHELNAIRKWNPDDFNGLMAYIKARWKFAEDGYWEEKGRNYFLHTAGWSGNEEIISALQANHMFWYFYWKSSNRGGHYVFERTDIGK